MKVIDQMYCGFDTETNTYEAFFHHKNGVVMCGISPKDIKLVQIIEVEEKDAEYWCWLDSYNDITLLIFSSLELLKMCSHDGFKSDIEAGEGRIVPAIVKEIQE